MKDKEFRIISILNPAQFSENGLTAEIELFREGTWKHDAAPNGWFVLDQNRINNFITNFNRGICGKEIPLEFGHIPDSKTTPGWITKMYSKYTDGVCSLWATLNLTDREIAKRVKDGSLKYISPTVISDYLDTASGQEFEVIRSATLTNYPHIKNLNPVAVNFEEIKEEYFMKGEDALKKNEISLEDLDSLTLDNLKSEIELEYLTEDQIDSLAKKFEMTTEQFQEKYPEAGKEMYGNVPKIKVPKQIPPARRQEFLEIFAEKFNKYKSVEKALEVTLKKMGIQLEETEKEEDGVKFAEKVMNVFKAYFSPNKEEDKEKEKNVDVSKFEELQGEVTELRLFKEKAEFEEDGKIVAQFEALTPAGQKILQTLLNLGRKASVEFEDQKISVRDLVLSFIKEAQKSPKVNLFERKSEAVDKSIDLSEDRDKRAKALMNDDPKLTYREALERVIAKEN